MNLTHVVRFTFVIVVLLLWGSITPSEFITVMAMIEVEILVKVYAVLITVVLPLLWSRHKQLYKLASTVYDAAKNKEVDEKEFQEIADMLGDVLYPKEK